MQKKPFCKVANTPSGTKSPSHTGEVVLCSRPSASKFPNTKDPKAMDAFQAVMDDVHDKTIEYVTNLAQKLNVKLDTADDIYYLRTRSYHTEEKEQYLIDMDKAGVTDLAVGSGDEWDSDRYLSYAAQKRGVNKESLIGERARLAQERFDAILAEVKSSVGTESP